MGGCALQTPQYLSFKTLSLENGREVASVYKRLSWLFRQAVIKRTPFSMNAKVILLCLIPVVLSRPEEAHPVGYVLPTPEPLPEGMPFEYNYAVKDDKHAVDFGHDTKSDGQHVTGKYHVLLPDGRTQVVTYTVDPKGGYQPVISYQ
ncbi:cuticle protein 19.8-like [Macrobrachium rosenbergii]|uniref:cuticle protein 19.8-like n=1 Tax=Macrobrachium rosenbergii TaxID=79674 RepID=UPI0034D67574